MKQLINSLIYGSILLFTVACGHSNTVYHSFQTIEKEGWGKNDTLFFFVPIADTSLTLQSFIDVRNLNTYPYQDLYLTVSHNLKGYFQWETDTLTFRIANEKGKWLGDGWGSLYQLSMQLTTGKAKRPYITFKIIPAMRDKLLIGIHDIGLKIMRLEPSVTSGINAQKDKQ